MTHAGTNNETNEKAAETRTLHIAAFCLVGILTAIRLWYGATHNLVQDETYYWQWSRFLAPSYYDQGPGIAYVIRLSTLLFGSGPLGVRALPTVLSGFTGLFVFWTARRWLGNLPALFSLLLLSVAPLFAIGGVLATYDGPQVFCWAAAMLSLSWTVKENKVGGWYLTGTLVGLGLLCKLTMLLFAPGVLLFLLFSPASRKWLLSPHPYLAFGIALLLFAPVVVWNAQHSWAGVLHVTTLGNRSRDAAPGRWFGEFLGGQALALSPAFWMCELIALWNLARAVWQKRTVWNVSHEAGRFLLAFAAPTLLVCFTVALRSKQEVNWPAPAHLAGLMVLSAWFAWAWNGANKASARKWIGAGVAFSLLIVFVVFYPALVPAMGIHLTAKQAEKLNETYGWQTVANSVAEAQNELAREGKPVFLAGLNYRVNSAVAFYLPNHPQTQGLFLRSRRDEYWIWTKPDDLVGQNAILSFDDTNPDAFHLAQQYFDSVTPLPPVFVYRPGYIGPVRRWYRFACRNFHGYDPDKHANGY